MIKKQARFIIIILPSLSVVLSSQAKCSNINIEMACFCMIMAPCPHIRVLASTTAPPHKFINHILYTKSGVSQPGPFPRFATRTTKLRKKIKKEGNIRENIAKQGKLRKCSYLYPPMSARLATALTIASVENLVMVSN